MEVVAQELVMIVLPVLRAASAGTVESIGKQTLVLKNA